MATKTETAQERYINLVSAMDDVQESLDELNSLIKRFDPPRVNWRVKDKRELQALRRKAQDRLDDMRETAKKYEADMIAKEWRA